MDDQSTEQRHIRALDVNDLRSISGYRLLGRLGMGGMGVVYLAEGKGGTRVALKVVRTEVANQSQFRVRFAREVEAARAVSGQYTARLIDADTTSSPQWIATEYVAGPTLAEHVETHGPMPEDQVHLLALGLAEAIEAIHAAGLIHRDLKPSNIILSADGPKVIDFGISQAADATSLTQTGVYVGSLAWMSPEQVTGEDLSRATDMFSLGLLLAYASSGEHPYGEGRPEAVAFRMVNQRPDLSGLPPSLATPVARLLATDPTSRPSPAQVVTTFADDATRISDITKVMTASWDATIVGDPLDLPATHDSPQTTTTTPTRRRRRGVFVALGGLAAVAATTAGAMAFGVLPMPIRGDVDSSTPSAVPTPSPTSEATTEPTATPDGGNEADDTYPVLVESTLTVRSGPYTDAQQVGTVASNQRVTITCATQGDAVVGPDGTPSAVWNQIAAPVSGWVSDAYVDSGAAAPQKPCDDVPTRAQSAPPNDNSSWPDLGSGAGYPASTSNEAGWDIPPDFPTEVAGYALSYEDSTTSRAFEDSFRAVDAIPSSMNGCLNRRYYIRWRSLADDYTVEAIWTAGPPAGDDPFFLPEGGTAQGNAGWMSGWGCQVPAFSLIDSPGPGNLTDVVVEFQVWEPAV